MNVCVCVCVCVYVYTRSVRKVSDRIFLCEHLMDYNLARLHEPTYNNSLYPDSHDNTVVCVRDRSDSARLPECKTLCNKKSERNVFAV